PTTSAAGKLITITYAGTGALAGLSVQVDYLLNGGIAGSHASDVAETINITNTTGSSLDFHFFEYSGFDLNGDDTSQVVNFANANTVNQQGGGVVLSETVVTPAPSAHQAALFPVLLNSLNDGSPTTLNGTNNAGPGDATWAFQWDTTIANNSSFQ